MSNTSSSNGGGTDTDAIRDDIERTRADLADTVDALHARLDVKTRTRAKVDETKERAATKVAEARSAATTAAAEARDRATTDTGKPRPEILGGAVAVLAAVVALVWWRRR